MTSNISFFQPQYTNSYATVSHQTLPKKIYHMITTAKINGKEVRLKTPILLIAVVDEDGEVSIEYDNLNIFVVEQTLKDAEIEFNNWLEFLYNDYVLADENELSSDAIEYKCKLLKYIGAV